MITEAQERVVLIVLAVLGTVGIGYTLFLLWRMWGDRSPTGKALPFKPLSKLEVKPFEPKTPPDGTPFARRSTLCHDTRCDSFQLHPCHAASCREHSK